MINGGKSYVVWGSGGHAKVLADVIYAAGGEIVALFDNNPDVQSCLPTVPLYLGAEGFQKWLDKYRPATRLGAVLAIGGSRGKDRLELAQRFRMAGFDLPTLIHQTASVSEAARIGEGCQVLAQAIVSAGASLGDVCIINNAASVDHDCTLGNGVHLAPGALLCGCVTVEHNAMIGARAVVLPRLHIGEGAVIGAGAVVTKDVRAGTTVVGNPAKIMGSNR